MFDIIKFRACLIVMCIFLPCDKTKDKLTYAFELAGDNREELNSKTSNREM